MNRRSGRLKRVGPCWLPINFVAVLTGAVLLSLNAHAPLARQDGEPPGAKPGDAPTVTEQGGYVERLPPGVDYKDRLPRLAPRSPADSLAGFSLVDGFEIELVASEPMIADAVDMAFDENGRLFVAELITYSERADEKVGRITMLEDADGDGTMDGSTVFADGLTWPTGLLCYDGGLFVATQPDLIYCKDTDGDGKADVCETVFTGFDTSNPNACPNSLRWGLDGRVHVMTSTSGGLIRSLRHERMTGETVRPVQMRGRDFSFDPRTGQLRPESGGSQFGMTFDAWGRKFESSNSAPIEMVMYEDRYIARNPYLVAPPARVPIWTDGATVYRTSPTEPWRAVRTEMRISGSFSGPVEGGGKPDGYFTAACGVFVCTGSAWPADRRGNAYVCEGAGNLVHEMRLEPAAVAMRARRTIDKSEFLTSEEVWFRPIQFCDAPDGTLYLADMYREVYEHPNAVPPSVKKYLDLNTGNDRGRIYRIVPEGFRQPPPVRLGLLSSGELVPLLAHENGWHRRTAARLLAERQDEATCPGLAALAEKSASPLGRMHAMHVLAGYGEPAPETVLARLGDLHPRVREHAVRLAEHVLADSPAVRDKLCSMVGDDDVRVRHQLGYTLGEIQTDGATAALAELARHDTADPWIRLAVLSSCFARAGDLATRLAGDTAWRTTASGRALLEQLAQQAALHGQRDQVAQVFDMLGQLGPEEKVLAENVVRGLGRGFEKSNNPMRDQLASGNAGAVLAEMIHQARAAAADAEKPPGERAEAIRSLALAPLDQVDRILEQLLDGRQPQQVQKAALQTLGRFSDDEVAETIVDAWPGFSPNVRGEAIEALFARRAWLDILLAAVEDGRIAPSQLDPARIDYLRKHPDARVRASATRVLGDVKLARREEAVAAYRDVLAIKGDLARGKEAFKKECSICHQLEGVGYDLGLPLSAVKNRGRETILLSVLDPNREVNPAYLNYMVLTEQGKSITGMITSETATSITLRRAEGESDTVLRTDVDEMFNSGLSIMPEGLEKQIDRQQMADLIEYLMAVQ